LIKGPHAAAKRLRCRMPLITGIRSIAAPAIRCAGKSRSTEACQNHYCLKTAWRTFKPSTLPPMMYNIDQLYWAGEPVGAVGYADSDQMRTVGEDPRPRCESAGVCSSVAEMDWRETGPQQAISKGRCWRVTGRCMKAGVMPPTLVEPAVFAMQAELELAGSPSFRPGSQHRGSFSFRQRCHCRAGENRRDAAYLWPVELRTPSPRRAAPDFSDLFAVRPPTITLTGICF